MIRFITIFIIKKDFSAYYSVPFVLSKDPKRIFIKSFFTLIKSFNEKLNQSIFLKQIYDMNDCQQQAVENPSIINQMHWFLWLKFSKVIHVIQG
jgi:hypothetical protein